MFFEDENGKIELFDHVDMAVELSGTVIMEDGTREKILMNANFEAGNNKGIVTFWMYCSYI